MQEPLCILGKRQTVLQMALHLQQMTIDSGAAVRTLEAMVQATNA